MACKNRFILVAIFAVVLLLTSCARQPVPPPEQPPAEQVITPEPSPPEQEEIIDPQPEPEYEAAGEEPAPTIATAAAQIYYDFFSNSFEVVEYMSIHGSHQLWGHNLAGELRLTKIVFIYLIEGFDDPVLILLEFNLYEDSVNIIEWGQLYAYLIRDGELCGDITRAEFDMIFSVIDDGSFRPTARHQDEIVRNIDINGERLFLFDFAGASTEELMMLLDKLREHF